MSSPQVATVRAPAGGLMGWIDRNIFDLGRQLQLSYLPPLMVYMAAGISGITGIAGTFFVKEYLGLTAADLAALGFWAGLPWALKMPLGHLVDLLWKRKSLLVYTGALLLATSVLIMVGLLTDRAAMEAIMPANRWFVLSALLAPVGYVLQDVVADAMTVEAVPRFDEQGKPLDEAARRIAVRAAGDRRRGIADRRRGGHAERDLHLVLHDPGIGRIDEAGVDFPARDIVERLAHVLREHGARLDRHPELRRFQRRARVTARRHAGRAAERDPAERGLLQVGEGSGPCLRVRGDDD